MRAKHNLRLRKLQPDGFALVVTVSLMILLTVIAMRLLGFSAIALRSGSQEQARMAAQTNARLALALAIGELQSQLGPDQRISANGAIVATSGGRHTHLTGVWDSWIAGPKAGAPVNAGYPSAESHHQTIGDQPDDSMHPEYGRKNKHFRSWLASLNPAEAANPATPVSLVLDGKPMPTKDATAIRLVGQGSLGNDAFRRNHRLTVLGAENQVDIQAQVGRRHDASLSRTLRGAIRKSRKSGGDAPG